MLQFVILAQVAFLNAGEVWTVSSNGGTPTRITQTGARVEDFRMSRDGRYLAYAKRVRQAEERPITSIVVVRVATGAVLTETRYWIT
jgi:Tol biopolymer transport system component